MEAECTRDAPKDVRPVSSSSDIVIMDDRILDAAARSFPPIQSVNVTKSALVHFGPKFVSVTQNVDNTQVVKDLPFPRYLWDVAKSTTRAERLSCAAALALLATCIVLVVYFVAYKTKNTQQLEGNEDWFKTREEWLYQFNFTTESMQRYAPGRLVIVAHTVSSECYEFRVCAAEMRRMQVTFKREHGYDLPYNFVIGNDGRVYEGRGWNVVGAHIEKYNGCSVSVAFIGNYGSGGTANASPLQLQRLHMLLEQGVSLGHLHEDFQVLGSRDLRATQSPGDRLYKVLRQLPNYGRDNVFKGRTCDEIKDYFENSTSAENNDTAGWFISRQAWGAPDFNTTEPIAYQPVRMVVIAHTVTSECHRFISCAVEMRRLQRIFATRGTDIPYNFMIGNDGRVYEARGWDLAGEHVEGYDSCSISVAFIGDYRDGVQYTNATDLQLQRLSKILEEGVELGHIHKDYQVLGTRDLRPTLSPGETLYNIIMEWPHFAHENVFRGKTCQEISDAFDYSTTEDGTQGTESFAST